MRYMFATARFNLLDMLGVSFTSVGIAHGDFLIAIGLGLVFAIGSALTTQPTVSDNSQRDDLDG